MKKQISRALLGLVAVLTLAGAAHAQGSRGMEIYVPFDFVAGEKRMPAGGYTVRRVRHDSESALLIQGEGKGAASAVVLTSRGDDNPARAALTFRVHGDRYFLAEVSMPGVSSVREAPKTGAERRFERELAAQSEDDCEPKKVTVVGRVQ